MCVIKELRSLTKMTNKEIGLNKSISENFTKAEQVKLFKIAQALLEDEIIHAMSILTVENKIKSDIGD